MKIVTILALLSNTAFCQWQLRSDAKIFAVVYHDSVFFESYESPSGYHVAVLRNITGGRVLDSGIEFKLNGPITSFACMGPYVYASSKGAYRTSNDGNSWGSGGVLHPFVNGPYLFGSSKTSMYRSRDTGANWVGVPCPQAINCAAYQSDMIGATYGGIYYSHDTGTTWTKSASPITHDTIVAALGPLFFAANGMPNGLARSTDRGETWTLLPFSHPTRSLITINSTIIVGTDSGVFVSLDSGNNWQQKNEGLDPYLKVGVLGVFDTMLFVNTTKGDGKWYSGFRPLRDFVPLKSDVNTIASKDTISIYPNPTFSSIRIDFGSAAVRRVELLDVLGESKQVLAPRELILTLDLTSLPSGTYFLRFETEKGTVMRKIQKE